MKRRNQRNGGAGHPHQDGDAHADLASSESGPVSWVDADDRMIDFALEEIERERTRGGGRLGGSDMVARIRNAWDRGLRGTGLSDLDEPPRLTPLADPRAGSRGRTGESGSRALRPVKGKVGDDPSRRAAGPRRWRRVAAVAAALLVATIGLLLQRERGPSGTGQGFGPGTTAGGGTGTGTGEVAVGGPAGGIDGPVQDPRVRLAAMLPDKKRTEMRATLTALLEWRPLVNNLVEQEYSTELRDQLLADALEDGPAWAFLELEVEQLAERIEVDAPPRVQRRLVALAREAPIEQGNALARALWLQIPGAFEPQDLIVFADRDLFEFRREVVSRALARDEQTLDAIGGPDPLAAAWLLNRGDTRATAVLESAIDDTPLRVKDEATLWRLDLVALSASILELTDEGDAWSRAHQRVTTFVEELLELGRLEDAAMSVAVLEYFQGVPRPPEFPVVGYRQGITTWLEEQGQMAGTDAELRDRLAALAEWNR